jgi:predicted N-formylglutamate amidohydrolase
MNTTTNMESDRLLEPVDLAPYKLVNEHSSAPFLLVCEHAGRAVPSKLGNLGLSPKTFDLHIAYDIGAEHLARRMAEHLDASLVLQPYSRLVIDCNRPTGASDLIPEISDSVIIPANKDLGERDRQFRITEIFEPFHAAVAKILDRPGIRAAFAIHSFTPVLGGTKRPWHVGFAYRRDLATSQALAYGLNKLDPTLQIGMNKPYSIDDASDFFVPYHGEKRGLSHSLIEIRNDLLGTDRGSRKWADIMSNVIGRFAENQLQ